YSAGRLSDSEPGPVCDLRRPARAASRAGSAQSAIAAGVRSGRDGCGLQFFVRHPGALREGLFATSEDQHTVICQTPPTTGAAVFSWSFRNSSGSRLTKLPGWPAPDRVRLL